ncbi:MAG: prepilin-type N-terminal cleavage/methylation domain-containing protein [Planctomycetaceae bacterium]
MTFTSHPIAGPNRSRAFTLVELLVVFVLMSILSGMMAYALAGARQDARFKRAQAEARAISVILQQKINDVNLSPLSFAPPVDGGTGAAAPPIRTGVEQNRVNMLARRDLMRMVLPQCRADLIYPPARLQFRYVADITVPTVGTASSIKVKHPNEWAQMRRLAGFAFPSGADVEAIKSPPSSTPNPVFTDSGIDTVNEYFGTGSASVNLRNWLGLLRGHVIDLASGSSAPWPHTDVSGETWTREFESAECLYLILASTELYGERALDQFSARSIANLDGDAVPEIVDPWGVPYEFIREPAGRAFQAAVTAAPTTPHPAGADPQDYLRTDFRFDNNVSTVPSIGSSDDPYRLSPLVISAGPDGEFGIRRTFEPDGDFAADLMGMSPRASTANTRLAASPVSPAMGGAYQYPDPFVQRRASSSAPFESSADVFVTPPAELPAATIAAWSYDANGIGGKGLGAAILKSSGRPVDAFADDIASDGIQ